MERNVVNGRLVAFWGFVFIVVLFSLVVRRVLVCVGVFFGEVDLFVVNVFFSIFFWGFYF